MAKKTPAKSSFKTLQQFISANKTWVIAIVALVAVIGFSMVTHPEMFGLGEAGKAVAYKQIQQTYYRCKDTQGVYHRNWYYILAGNKCEEIGGDSSGGFEGGRYTCGVSSAKPDWCEYKGYTNSTIVGNACKCTNEIKVEYYRCKDTQGVYHRNWYYLLLGNKCEEIGGDSSGGFEGGRYTCGVSSAKPDWCEKLGYDYSEISPDGQKCTCHTGGQVICGDSLKEDTEECDDGNTNSGDGCSGTDTTSYKCCYRPGPNPNNPDMGALYWMKEECDAHYPEERQNTLYDCMDVGSATQAEQNTYCNQLCTGKGYLGGTKKSNWGKAYCACTQGGCEVESGWTCTENDAGKSTCQQCCGTHDTQSCANGNGRKFCSNCAWSACYEKVNGTFYCAGNHLWDAIPVYWASDENNCANDGSCHNECKNAGYDTGNMKGTATNNKWNTNDRIRCVCENIAEGTELLAKWECNNLAGGWKWRRTEGSIEPAERSGYIKQEGNAKANCEAAGGTFTLYHSDYCSASHWTSYATCTKLKGITLPATGSYGKIRGGDTSHVNEVAYEFGGMAGDVELTYKLWDIDYDYEVDIIINGYKIKDTVATTGNEQWSGVRTLTLPDDKVNDRSTNTLTFDNPKNPPNTWWWGVGSVSVEVILPEDAIEYVCCQPNNAWDQDDWLEGTVCKSGWENNGKRSQTECNKSIFARTGKPGMCADLDEGCVYKDRICYCPSDATYYCCWDADGDGDKDWRESDCYKHEIKNCAEETSGSASNEAACKNKCELEGYTRSKTTVEECVSTGECNVNGNDYRCHCYGKGCEGDADCTLGCEGQTRSCSGGACVCVDVPIMCGDTIMEDTTLTADIKNDNDNLWICLTIGAPGVTLDCDGHTIEDMQDPYGRRAIEIENINSATGVDRTEIKNCVFKEWGDASIRAIGSSGIDITGNTFTDSKSDECIKLSNSMSITVKDNTINGCRLSGIYLDQESAHVTIQNNEIKWGTRYGIDSDDTRWVTIEDNEIIGNGAHGIVLTNSWDYYILNNTIKDQDSCGIFSRDGTNGEIRDNIIKNNAEGNANNPGCGIHLIDETATQITGNIICDNKEYYTGDDFSCANGDTISSNRGGLNLIGVTDSATCDRWPDGTFPKKWEDYISCDLEEFYCCNDGGEVRIVPVEDGCTNKLTWPCGNIMNCDQYCKEMFGPETTGAVSGDGNGCVCSDISADGNLGYTGGGFGGGGGGGGSGFGGGGGFGGSGFGVGAGGFGFGDFLDLPFLEAECSVDVCIAAGLPDTVLAVQVGLACWCIGTEHGGFAGSTNYVGDVEVPQFTSDPVCQQWCEDIGYPLSMRCEGDCYCFNSIFDQHAVRVQGEGEGKICGMTRYTRTCAEQGGEICGDAETCDGACLYSTDPGCCCAQECTAVANQNTCYNYCYDKGKCGLWESGECNCYDMDTSNCYRSSYRRCSCTKVNGHNCPATQTGNSWYFWRPVKDCTGYGTGWANENYGYASYATTVCDAMTPCQDGSKRCLCVDNGFTTGVRGAGDLSEFCVCS